MGKNGKVEHEGIVKDISTNSVKVGFVSQPSCIGCYAKDICNLEQRPGELLDVHCHDINHFSIGEKVKIIISESQGLKAVLIAYLFPFILIILSLIILVSLLDNEIIAGIFSLALLVPYYIIVYFFRNRIKKEINFTLEKYNQ